jgi:hypothetical protein
LSGVNLEREAGLREKFAAAGRRGGKNQHRKIIAGARAAVGTPSSQWISEWMGRKIGR